MALISPKRSYSNPLQSIALDVRRNYISVFINIEPDDSVLEYLKNAVLQEIRITRVKKVIIDLSGVRIVDSLLFKKIEALCKMINMMGAEAVLTGISPGVAVALVDSGVDFSDVLIKQSVEDAEEYIAQLCRGKSTSQNINADYEDPESKDNTDNSGE